MSSDPKECLLNRESFIPVSGPNVVVLVNVTKIVKAEVPLNGELDENAEILATRHNVGIRMLDGSFVKGDFLIELPEEYQRVKDYLNQPVRFLRLIQGDFIFYLNREYILSVVDNL